MNERQTILLVDDSGNDLDLMRLAFKKAGINNPLQEVHDGEEAIAYLKGEGIYRSRGLYPLPAFMLLDLKMPRKDGFDVLEWIRAERSFVTMPVMVLTASLRKEDVERAFELRATAFLVKPVSLDHLTATFRRLRDWLEINHFPPWNQVVSTAWIGASAWVGAGSGIAQCGP
jgi:CheY-like chemotaxis protein